MSKLRKSLFVFGLIILCGCSALVTFLSLSATGMIASDPIEITLSVDSVTERYDALPHKAKSYTLAKGELLDGHSVQVLEYVGSQTDVGSSESDMKVRIVDEDNRDVSGEYGITVVRGNITVTKRTITVNQGNVTEEYNGNAVINDKFTVAETNGLCAGHRVCANALDTGVTDPTGAVPVVGEFAPSVYDAAGNNVTDNYDIIFNAGDTEINKRKLVLNPIGFERAYNGEPLMLKASDYYISQGSLIEGHRIKNVRFASDGNDRAYITDVGSISVKIAGIEIDGVEDATKYYSISSGTATLTVTPKLLNVVGKSGKHGDDFGHDPAEKVTDLVEGDVLTLTYTATITDVGSVPNTFEVDVTRDGKSVLSNYAVNKTYGTLTMERKSVEVNLPALEAEYDGKVHKIDFASLAETFGAFNLNKEDIEIVAPEMKNAGEYEYTVRLTDTENANKFYLKINNAGKYTVTKAELEIQAINPYTKVYDGKPAKATRDDICIVLDSEASVYVSEVQFAVNQINACVGEFIDVSGWVLRDKDTDRDVSSNYVLTWKKSPEFQVQVTVKPRKLMLALGDITTNMEDAKGALGNFTDSEILAKITETSGLCGADYIDIGVSGLEVGGDIYDGYWTLTGFVIKNSAGEDISENYDFTEVLKGLMTYVQIV